METLQELREQLDSIDSQIVELYEKRMDVCEKVGEYKIATGKPVLDAKRESEKLQCVQQLASQERNKEGICELFQLLMTASRKLQQQMINEAENNRGD